MALVPEELRVAYRLLKNAGCLPSELQTCAELREIEQLLTRTHTGEERRNLPARMNFCCRGALWVRGACRWMTIILSGWRSG